MPIRTWHRTLLTLSIGVAIAFASAAVAQAADAAAKPPSEFSALVIPPGRIDRAVREIGPIARALLKKTGVPGMAIAIVHDDRVVYAQGFGVRRAGTSKEVDAHTVFELASVSKPLGAAVIAGAVGSGCVHWTDPVAEHLPGFTLSDPQIGSTVTIADMYAHRSGLPDHAGDLLEDLGFDQTSILHRLALQPLAPFRITYNYTNFGLTAAAEAAANACGKPWEQLSHDILYAPLGMTETSSRFSDYARASNRADLHVRVGKTWLPLYVRDADAEAPAGGASSSVSDLARYLRLELANGRFAGRRIVDEKALLETRNPNLMIGPLATPNSRATFYGLGMNVSYDSTGRLRLSHSGAFRLGAATSFSLLPAEHLGIVVLTNGAPIGLPETVAADFLDLAEFGKIQFDWFNGYGGLFRAMSSNPSSLAGAKRPAQPARARSDDAYIGTYSSSYYGPAIISGANGHLVLTLGPHHLAFALTHWSGDIFSYLPRGENAAGITAITFSVATGDSRAGSLTIENLNAEKLGIFARNDGAESN